MLTNWNKIIKIIRLIKGEWSKTLQLSKGNDAWNSGEVDPCAHGRRRRITCFTNSSLHFRNSSEMRGAYRAEQCTPKPCAHQLFSLIPVFIHPPSFLCSSWKSPKDKSRLTFVQQSSQWRSGCDAPSTPKTVRADKQLVFDTSWDISTHVTANGPHPQWACMCVCVWVGVIRPLTSMWPDLFLSSSDPALPLFISLIQQCSSSSPFHADAPVIHIHANVKTSKPLTPDSLCQSPIATFTHCENPLSIKSANCHSVPDGIRCHAAALACHTPSVCQRVTPQWPDFQSGLSVFLSPSRLFGLPVHQLPI